MRINVVAQDKTVVIDDEGYFCPTLVVPDTWAHAYHWRDDNAAGVIEPIPSLGRDPEHFADPARMDFARDAFAAAKEEAKRAEAELEARLYPTLPEDRPGPESDTDPGIRRKRR